ncbi:MAG: hypothetical protein SPK65_09145 [Succinivibrio dextrinosolvens]|nr:hypothetical protein [Succinivibrio dextrinosolvens]MDY6466747.1 hypothetical protein [Succinivibrio dextrinosolvens]
MIGLAYLLIVTLLFILSVTHLFAALVSYHCNHFKEDLDSIRVDVLGIFCIILMLSGLIVYLSNYEGIL